MKKRVDVKHFPKKNWENIYRTLLIRKFVYNFTDIAKPKTITNSRI